MTKTYYGVVRDNIVVLLEENPLPNGTRVEIRVVPSEGRINPRSGIPDAVQAELLARGLLREIKGPPSTLPTDDYVPVQVKGKPLSEIVIEDRR